MASHANNSHCSVGILLLSRLAHRVGVISANLKDARTPSPIRQILSE